MKSSAVVFIRRCALDLVFCDPNSPQKIKDHCQFAIGLSGEIDSESGMIMNLVDVDLLLKKAVTRLQGREVKELFSFLQFVRNFFQDDLDENNKYAEKSIGVEQIVLKTSYGEIQWQSPWRDYDLVFKQTRKLKISLGNNSHEVKKISTLRRGSRLNIFEKYSAETLEKLFYLTMHPKDLKNKMLKEKNLSGFGFYNHQLKAMQIYELSLQEFCAKTFRK